MVSVQEQQSSFSCLATEAGGGGCVGREYVSGRREKSRQEYKK